jgi:hypothetical protein
MQRWVERPEARWALWTGLAGGFVTLSVSAWRILAEGTAMAGFSFVFVPLVAAVVAVPAAVWGAALGHVALHLRGRAPEPKIVFWAALAAAAMPPAALAYYCFSNMRL